jgi:hypothetical protein
MNEQAEGLQRLGRYSGLAVVLSLVACYGTAALVLLLATAGITLNVHEGAWAAAIVVFAWTAVLAVGVNIPAGPEYSRRLRKIAMMETVDGRELENVVGFG